MIQRTHQEFLDLMLSNLSNTEDKSPNSFSYDILSAAGIVFEDVQRTILELVRLFDADNLTGEWLEKRVFQISGLERKKATKATGIVTVTGQKDISIPKGIIFLSGSLEFVSLEEKIISTTGNVDILVECKETGAVGDIVAGSITKTKKKIDGISDITNKLAFTNGYEEESDDDLRERYYDKIMNPPKGGNPAHYKLWATEVDGIWSAKVFRTWNGPGTTRVVVIGMNRKGVDTKMLEKVKQHILEEAPIRYESLTVESAKEKVVNLSVSVKWNNGYTAALGKESIKKSLEDYFYKISFKENIVSYAKVGKAILSNDCVFDYSNLTINGIKDNIPLQEDEVPILGTLEVKTI